jgi:hypothetical protein
MRRKIAYLQLSVVNVQLPFIMRQLIIGDGSRRRLTT